MFDFAAAGGDLFHAATGLDEQAFAAVQERVRQRLLRVFVRRGLLPADAARAMAQWAHGGGFSVDGSVRIIAFITDASTRRDILAHLGEPIVPPRIAPARAPPLWAAAGAEHDPTPDPVLPPTPAYEFDQRLIW